MKANKRLLIALILLFSCYNVFGQNQIARWQGFKQAALCFTFDDNLAGQFSHALDTMETYGYRGTLFVITSQVNWTLAQDAHNRGHEIGSHSATSPHLKSLDSASIYPEIANAYNAIKQNIAGAKVLSIGWPYGEGGGSAALEKTIRNIAEKFHAFGRNASSGSGYDPFWHVNNSWFDRYYLQTGAYLIQSNTSANNINNLINNAMTDSGRIALLYHGIETGGYNNVTKENFGQHVQAIANHNDSLWVGTFSQLSLYQKNWHGAQLSLTNQTQNGNSETYTYALTNPNITDTSLYYPLTLKLMPPIDTTNGAAFEIDSVVQGNKSLSFDGNATDGIIVKATPNLNGGDFTIYLKKYITGMGTNVKPKNDKITIYPNPVSNNQLLVNGISVDYVSYQIINLKGQVVQHNNIAQHTQPISIGLNRLQKGVYVLQIMQNNGQTQQQRFIVE